MEDVIFQGSAARRPVNVTEVSLFLDNSDGDLPIAYREVVVTRRLSRSGQSEYLLNGSPVRLRDIQDLLRGTGLGSDAGVVIEAKMIDLLLSDRAEERRSLFEEAAGIGLYRDRKHSTERRLEETAVDLQRVEDLIAEVQSQIRSLARQRGKAERHAKLSEEKFAVQLTLARRQLDRLTEEAARHGGALPGAGRSAAGDAPAAHRKRPPPRRVRSGPRGRRSAADRDDSPPCRPPGRAGQARWRSGARRRASRERRGTAAPCRRGAGRHGAARAATAATEQAAATEHRESAAAEHERILQELSGRAEAEEEVRRRLAEQRGTVRRLEQELQSSAQTLKALEGERTALEGELASLRERAAQAAVRRSSLQQELAGAERRRDIRGRASRLPDPGDQARGRPPPSTPAMPSRKPASMRP